MKKNVEQLTVEVVQDVIHIVQKDPMGNHDDCVVVSPDQVVQLIEWLRDAREHIQNKNSPD